MTMTMTPLLATWGAALGTLSFVWNIWKSRRENPQIDAVVEAIPSFTIENGFAAVRITLRNRGGKKATVERIMFYRRQGWLEDGYSGFVWRLLRLVPWQQNLGVSQPETVRLPAIIDSGGMWQGLVRIEANEDEENEPPTHIGTELPKLISNGKLRYSVHCSHTDRRIRGFVRIEGSLIHE